MKKTSIRLLALVLVLCSCIGLFAGCSGSSSSSDDAYTFSWWIASMVDSSYYTDYDENPVIQYISNCKTFENSEGEQVHISFDFQNGITGSEQDNFNNMMATGTYTDIIDPTYMTDSLIDLYEAGTILDMTEYVEAYMPNYLAYIEEHPELKIYFTVNVDGEEKYLSIPSTYEQVDMYGQWYGFEYRRDWIVKYGTNPFTGEAFTGYYTLDNDGNAIQSATCDDNVNGDSWVDDVVFPSGGSDPIYISDWEWMFEIFETAMEAEGITDGYCLSMYYPGYVATGDLVSGFGGINAGWYIDEDGYAQFGPATEGFKAYLQCMNTWYENGWLDQRFNERSSDMFYSIDDTSVRQGKVGLWLGLTSQILSRMQNDNLESTKDMVVYTCASPINDVYGDDSVQNIAPTCYTAVEMMSTSICITDKASDKDLKVLCEYLDYLYSEEGLLLSNGGLNEEQAAEANNSLYSQYDLDYAYTAVTNDDGTTSIDFVDVLYEDEGGIRGAMINSKSWHLNAENRYVYDDTDTYIHMRENWVLYEAAGAIGGMLNSRMTSDDWATYQKITARIGSEFMYIEVPKFITGEYNFDSDWDTFQTNLTKRNYQSVTDAYNRALGNE